ncbi:serine hydrolase [Fluviicola sp.]|uniref:serine hydrolase n=1 Tax=Fluviicola sp. TaxID=1917219 RepID=UPI003D29DC51
MKNNIGTLLKLKYGFYLTIAFALLFIANLSAQTQGKQVNETSNMLEQPEIQHEIEALLKAQTHGSFSGIVLIKENDRFVYSKVQGYSDLENKIPLVANSQFVIGSVSKQFTAVIILLELEKGRCKLEDVISTYLPELQQSWKDSVTIYQLLTHTHGIVSIDKPLSFAPGTRMDYGNGNDVGYYLLSKIIEKISGKSFADISMALFKKCGMNSTFHPDVKQYKNLVKGYTEQSDGTVLLENASFSPAPAAGAFISTVYDLCLWNEHLHQGKILKPETYQLMIRIQPHVVREHPVWGVTEYGLGLTVCKKEHILQLGQTGFAPGFISMNFYFPQTKTSVVVLQNRVNSGTLSQKFYYQSAIIALLRKQFKCGKLIVEKNEFNQKADTLPYRLVYPDDEILTEKSPLLIYLHGGGSRGIDNEKPLREFSPYFIDSITHQNNLPGYILVPQCAENDVWVSFPDFPNRLSVTKDATPSSKVLLALIHHLIETKNIDPNRIYLTGFSMGGEGTFDLLRREQDLFACAVPLASVADTSMASIIKDIPIWAFHGAADQVNDVKYSRMIIEAITKLGGHPKYTEPDNIGHDCRNYAYRNEELWKWVFEQRK